MPPIKDAHLYTPAGAAAPPKKKTPANPLAASASTLNFASHLSSLINASKSSSSSSTDGKPRPGRSRTGKEDIFATHNRGTRKRALADLAADEGNPAFAQRHATSSEALDAATLKRQRLRMEEKARLYAAMQRGDVEDEDGRYAVDFERKVEERGGAAAGTETESDEDDDQEDSDNEIVEYVDEFGRDRTGTKAEARREERRKMRAARERERAQDDRYAARPTMPSNIIYGDTIQSAAFNPDAAVAEAMEELARKRDAALTPPPDTHFDASQEIRVKGTGFYQFALDADTRRRQKEELDRLRRETERAREERARGVKEEERRRVLEERKRLIREKREKVLRKQADSFLESLQDELGKTEGDGVEGDGKGKGKTEDDAVHEAGKLKRKAEDDVVDGEGKRKETGEEETLSR